MIRLIIVTRYIRVRATPIVARQKKFPLRVTCLLDFRWQHAREAFDGTRRWARTAALADNADDCLTVPYIFCECAEKRLAVGTLLKVALNGHGAVARRKIAAHVVARFAEFARDCGDEDAQAGTGF